MPTAGGAAASRSNINDLSGGVSMNLPKNIETVINLYPAEVEMIKITSAAINGYGRSDVWHVCVRVPTFRDKHTGVTPLKRGHWVDLNSVRTKPFWQKGYLILGVAENIDLDTALDSVNSQIEQSMKDLGHQKELHT